MSSEDSTYLALLVYTKIKVYFHKFTKRLLLECLSGNICIYTA